MARTSQGTPIYDFIIVGSGFGGSVCAMRLAERGHRVLVLEKGKRFDDADFARSTWNARKYLWIPRLRCFGILQISVFRHVWVLHGCGVGGGSLGYANVLMEPPDTLFEQPEWRRLADWRAVLAPHFAAAKRMLGVATNPRLWAADDVLRDIAAEIGRADSFRPATVGTYFGEPGHEGETVPDPFFGGEGPSRAGCLHCGGCMVGCRHNAKNTLPKNYLYFAERLGAEVRAERAVRDIVPVGGPDGARYLVQFRRSTAFVSRHEEAVLARHVIVSAGALGTVGLMFRCRDVTRSLPRISRTLGHVVRTNSESILGSVSRARSTDYSQGIAITSVMQANDDTTIEPVRYPAGSDAMRFLGGPMVRGRGVAARLGRSVAHLARHPVDFARTHILSGWAKRSTILLVMQSVDHRIRLQLGRGTFTLFRRALVSAPDPASATRGSSEIGRGIGERFAARTNGVLTGSINEKLFDTPLTAHILGGCPMGVDASDGVIDTDCQVFGHPGLFVVDGSIMPGNPGVNPSLTIAALAEYAALRIHDIADGQILHRKSVAARQTAEAPETTGVDRQHGTEVRISRAIEKPNAIPSVRESTHQI